MTDETTALFGISAAAELAGMHPQTLRQYDRIGLVRPQRTAGRSRRYTLRDVVVLREVQRLSNEGVSLEGIRRVIELENQVHALQQRVSELQTALADALIYRPGGRTFAAGAEGEIVTLDQGRRRVQTNGGELVIYRPISVEVHTTETSV
ncbi:heat shock protein transcriptional repressor HspR [Pseudoclavibacter soli]|uniref:heat shock protein transcriptional repressor HspR n=1 Tax=Pseudoclavibacter soli TaxID=452623 RepID=UPI0004187ABF|nr:MerR family transcriptional regulator [Pseudoclavibacter soli]